MVLCASGVAKTNMYKEILPLVYEYQIYQDMLPSLISPSARIDCHGYRMKTQDAVSIDFAISEPLISHGQY